MLFTYNKFTYPKHSVADLRHTALRVPAWDSVTGPNQA